MARYLLHLNVHKVLLGYSLGRVNISATVGGQIEDWRWAFAKAKNLCKGYWYDGDLGYGIGLILCHRTTWFLAYP